jgi:hypothetical protein
MSTYLAQEDIGNTFSWAWEENPMGLMLPWLDQVVGLTPGKMNLKASGYLFPNSSYKIPISVTFSSVAVDAPEIWFWFC